MSVILSLLLASAPAASQAAVGQSEAVAETPVPAGKVSVANARSIVAAMQKEGYRAKLMTDAKAPYIESATNGATFTIYLQNCGDENKCQDVLFRSSYEKSKKDPLKVDAINAFNRKTRWARAYLDDENDPVLEMDLLFTNQLLDETMFGEALSVWNNVLGDFHKAIGF